MQFLLNTEQAAARLGVEKSFLERDRWEGAKVPFVRLGARTIRYRQQDLEQYIESQIRHSTSDYGAGR